MVRIYVKGELVATHIRSYSQGAYTTVKEHLCSHHQHYLNRSPEFYTKQAAKTSIVFAQLIELMFNTGRHPELLYRSCDGLLSLQRKTDPASFEKACQMAIDNQNYSYRFINKILTNKMTEQLQTTAEKPLPSHSNIRGKEYYAQNQQSLNFK
jgi:hypothetical protein